MISRSKNKIMMTMTTTKTQNFGNSAEGADRMSGTGNSARRASALVLLSLITPGGRVALESFLVSAE